ncbi:restriction endonuclease [Nonomuraea sp. NPDC003707]
MPARSNDFQAVVYFVKAHLDPNVTVTESASLPDRTTGKPREVDVLLVAQVAGHLIHIGVECRDRSRKADVSWVEEMHGKHADLPTDRLVLVSASGFTKAAAVKARHYNIEAVTPERPITQDGSLARLRHPLADLYNIMRRDLVALHGQVELDDGQLHESELTLNHVLFAADGTEVGHIADLIESTRDSLDPRPAIAAMYEQDRRPVRVEQQVVWSGPEDVFLRRESSPPQLLRLVGLKVELTDYTDVRRVELSAGELQGTAYAYGSGQVGGNQALLIFTEADEGARLSVRLTDAAGTVTDLVADRVEQQLLPHRP